MAKVERKQTTVYRLELTKEEFSLLKALAQNPHPDYMRTPSTAEECKLLFETLREAWID